MNEHIHDHDDFSPLLDAACDGLLNDAQLDELAAALECDADACKTYIDHISLQADIRFLGRAERLCQIGLDGVQAKLSQPSQPTAAPMPALGLFSSAFNGTIGFFSQEVPFSLLIATVVTGLGLLMGSFIYVSHHNQIADNDRPASPSSLHLKHEPQATYIGRITGMVDVQWSDATTAAVTELVALNRKYALASGLMEITYDTGAKVILQGPCTYQADSPVGGFLSVGKLTARLEKKQSAVSSQPSAKVVSGQWSEKVASGQWPVASKEGSGVRSQGSDAANHKSEIINHKSLNPQIPNPSSFPAPRPQAPAPVFAVRTPTAIVTDLGTEFGVEVSPTGDTETHVLVGSVLFTRTGRSGIATEEQLLRAGKAARCNSRQGPISVVKADTKRFARFMPTSPEGYAAMVLAMKPVAYYRMESPADSNNRNMVLDSAGAHHGILHTTNTANEPWQQGRFGSALHFDGATYVDVPTLPSAEAGAISVVAWVRVDDQSEWANIASEQYARAWEDKTCRMQFGFGLFGDAGDLWAGVNDRHGLWCHLREGSPRPLSIGYWNHVAFVADGKTLQLYRGGRKICSTPCDGVCLTPPIKHLTIGCKNWSNSPDSPKLKPVQFWHGAIDELAIFNHALSAADIRKLFYCSSTVP